MNDLRRQAQALGDRTRFEIYTYLSECGRQVGVAELTDHTGLHHNAVRRHLRQLVAAGLVVESIEHLPGRGRPPLVYAIDPASESRWGTSGPYERLSALLVEVIRTGDSAVAVGRRAGRTMADALDAPHVSVVDVSEVMARLGFEPTTTTDGETSEVVLHTCPFAPVAEADPATVCDLHLGLAQGLVDRNREVDVDELTVEDPRRARCRLRLRSSTPADQR